MDCKSIDFGLRQFESGHPHLFFSIFLGSIFRVLLTNAPRQAYSKLAVVALAAIHRKLEPKNRKKTDGGGRHP